MVEADESVFLTGIWRTGISARYFRNVISRTCLKTCLIENWTDCVTCHNVSTPVLVCRPSFYCTQRRLSIQLALDDTEFHARFNSSHCTVISFLYQFIDNSSHGTQAKLWSFSHYNIVGSSGFSSLGIICLLHWLQNNSSKNFNDLYVAVTGPWSICCNFSFNVCFRYTAPSVSPFVFCLPGSFKVIFS